MEHDPGWIWNHFNFKIMENISSHGSEIVYSLLIDVQMAINGEKNHPSLIWLVLIHTVHMMFNTAFAPVSSPRSQSMLVQWQLTVTSSLGISLVLLRLWMKTQPPSSVPPPTCVHLHQHWSSWKQFRVTAKQMPSHPWMLRDYLSCYSYAPNSYISPPFEVVHVSHTVKILNKYTKSFDVWRP